VGLQFAAAGKQKDRHIEQTQKERIERERERVFSFAVIRVWGLQSSQTYRRLYGLWVCSLQQQADRKID
jgi:hypothetical protein